MEIEHQKHHSSDKKNGARQSAALHFFVKNRFKNHESADSGCDNSPEGFTSPLAFGCCRIIELLVKAVYRNFLKFEAENWPAVFYLG